MAQSSDQPSRRLEDLNLDDRLVEMLRDQWGIEELFPPQAEALPTALSGRNVMLTIPTASGKSLVAHLTIVHRLTTDLEGARALYIVPLKALATEKVKELRASILTVGPGQCVPWHHHSEVTDTVFCIEGPMQVETRRPDVTQILQPGKTFKVPAGRPHRVSGLNGGPCRFMIMQGVGKYDFDVFHDDLSSVQKEGKTESEVEDKVSYCTECGNDLSKDDLICLNCGAIRE